ncbi:LacI family DNA-binding transcriptional regulator [Streptomyces sp. NPDC091292]|uniref:LacI family DNA-binding transcriptional regulator n=1 Tax=Streptomyces sp. NPDC091292 TaxID=3365991 RepID=UPI0038254D05
MDDQAGSRPEDTPVTIYQVAQRAGVGIATVSRALRGTGSVGARTRERILLAARELNFVPSRLGVSLAEGRHAANGIVFPSLTGPYFGEVLLGYEEAAAELGRSVIVVATDGLGSAQEHIRDLAGRVDGVVIYGRTAESDVVAELVAEHKPTVLLAPWADVDGPDVLTTENTRSARELTEHLLSHGHRRFTYLGGPTGGRDIDERWAALVGTLAAAGVPAPLPVPLSGYGEAELYVAARAVLADRGRPDAPDVIVCSHDEVALAVLLAARELGLTVPDDVAVTGWDDVVTAKHSWPPLTTVRQPMRRMGGMAARSLDELISGTRTTPRHEVLSTRPVIRESCGNHPQSSRR